jgi:hypothetical protein
MGEGFSLSASIRPSVEFAYDVTIIFGKIIGKNKNETKY